MEQDRTKCRRSVKSILPSVHIFCEQDNMKQVKDFIFSLIDNLGIYRLLESTLTLQIGLYRTTNDLRLHIPIRYEIKIYYRNKILCKKVILFEFTLSSKIANK